MNPRFAYILDYFRKVYNISKDFKIGYGTTDQKINISKGKTGYFDTLKPYPEKCVIWKEWDKKNIPFLFECDDSKPIIEIKNDQLFINYDILASSFFFLSGWQEYVFMKEQSASSFPYHKSIQNKLRIIHLPVVNYYFDILKTAVEQAYNISLKINIWGENDFTLCLTHDIDKCNSGWLESGFSKLKHGHLSYFFKLITKKIFNNDVWFNFNEILIIERKYKANSSFYFLPRKRKVIHLFKMLRQIPSNADYDISKPKFREVFKKILEAGSEIGIHGSLQTHLNAHLFKKDLERVPYLVKGGRFHYLNFDITQTFNVLEQTGLNYDSTLGFTEVIGFRNGIAFPFPPYNIQEDRPYRILEIPLIVMDTTLKSYKNFSQNQILLNIESLILEVKKFNGCFTLLWHNNYFSPYKYSGWKELYEQILKISQKHNAAFMSGEQIYKQWQNLT